MDTAAAKRPSALIDSPLPLGIAMTAARPLPGASVVASPCVNICRMNAASGLCEGCLRTLDEIAVWSVLDDDGKRAVLGAIAERRRQS